MRKQLLFIVTLCLLSCSEDKTLQNISSIEIENAIANHPAVSQIHYL